jgi:hypothetical protein
MMGIDRGVLFRKFYRPVVNMYNLNFNSYVRRTTMPWLPLDLERLIFEMAALQDTDHDSRVRIILVAKRVYEWYV